jgi:hypothetical protein
MDRKMNVDPDMSEETHETMDPATQETMAKDAHAPTVSGMYGAMNKPGMDQSMDRSGDTNMHESMDRAMGTDMADTMGMRTNRQRKWGWFRRKSRRA